MKITPPLIAAAIASLVIHTAVVMSYTTTKIVLPNSKGSVFTIKIAEIKHIIPKDNKPIPITKKAQPRPRPVIKKNTANKEAVAATKEELKKETKVDIREQQNKILAQVKSNLTKKLNANFTYPKLAQRKNWQGKVILSLRVSSSGEITDIQLATSSGYNVLDMAAIDSLKRVEKLSNISLWFNNGLNIHLPVIYRLTES